MNTVFLLGSTLAAGTLSPASATATTNGNAPRMAVSLATFPGRFSAPTRYSLKMLVVISGVVATGSGAYLGPVTSTAIGRLNSDKAGKKTNVE